MTNTNELTTIDSVDLTHVLGGMGGDKWENVLGDAGNAGGAALGARFGGAPGALGGAVAGGYLGRAVGRTIDNYRAPGPLPAGAGYSQGRGPGSLNRGASGPF
ncbi:MAG: hypothetical protein ACKV2T_07225 [Kofleriaceae bacterium]